MTQAGHPIGMTKKGLYNTAESCHVFYRQTVSELHEGTVLMYGWVQSHAA